MDTLNLRLIGNFVPKWPFSLLFTNNYISGCFLKCLLMLIAYRLCIVLYIGTIRGKAYSYLLPLPSRISTVEPSIPSGCPQLTANMCSLREIHHKPAKLSAKQTKV